MTPRRNASSIVARSSQPLMCRASFASLAAIANDPPIKPTPTMASLSNIINTRTPRSAADGPYAGRKLTVNRLRNQTQPPHQLFELFGQQRLRAIAERLFGVVVDFDQERVRARGDGGLRQRR